MKHVRSTAEAVDLAPKDVDSTLKDVDFMAIAAVSNQLPSLQLRPAEDRTVQYRSLVV